MDCAPAGSTPVISTKWNVHLHPRIFSVHNDSRELGRILALMQGEYSTSTWPPPGLLRFLTQPRLTAFHETNACVPEITFCRSQWKHPNDHLEKHSKLDLAKEEQPGLRDEDLKAEEPIVLQEQLDSWDKVYSQLCICIYIYIYA